MAGWFGVGYKQGNTDSSLGGRNMEYTPMEKDVLAMMQRTDFKNISKADVISFASKIDELRP